MKCATCSEALKPNWKYCPVCSAVVTAVPASGPIGWTQNKIDAVFADHLGPQSTKPKADHSTGAYGAGVQAQVFEVIVRQGMSGAPWREICAGPLQVSNIDPEEVEAEIQRRRGGGPAKALPEKPQPSPGASAAAFAFPLASEQLAALRHSLEELGQRSDAAHLQPDLSALLGRLDLLASSIYGLEHTDRSADTEARLQNDLERENSRVRQTFKPGGQ